MANKECPFRFMFVDNKDRLCIHGSCSMWHSADPICCSDGCVFEFSGMNHPNCGTKIEKVEVKQNGRKN